MIVRYGANHCIRMAMRKWGLTPSRHWFVVHAASKRCGDVNRAAFNLHTSCDLVIVCSPGPSLLYSIKRLTRVPLPGLVSLNQALLRLTTKGEVSQAERCREPHCTTTVIVLRKDPYKLGYSARTTMAYLQPSQWTVRHGTKRLSEFNTPCQNHTHCGIDS